MTTRLQDAMVRLSSRLQGRDGRAVVYQQGASITISDITAVPTEEVHIVYDGDGTATKVQTVDWLFSTESLAGTTPRPGDRITEILDETEYQYEVLPLGKLPCFEWHDTGHVMFMIHSKRIQ